MQNYVKSIELIVFLNLDEPKLLYINYYQLYSYVALFLILLFNINMFSIIG